MKFSIIVAAYNVAEYLGECIESLVSQNFPDSEYEVLIVDDGSTDDSLNILNKYESNNENMKVISQINKGPGGARNTGLKYAKW